MALQELSSRAIIGSYYAALRQNVGAQWIGGVSNLFNTNMPIETYKWLGQSPAMREWIGGRNAKGLRTNGISIESKHFEATLELDVRDMRLDKTGQIMVRVRDMAARTNAHWAKLLTTLIVGGASQVCYDGQYFFDTDHVEGDSGTQSNSITYDVTTPTAPNAGEYESAIMAAVQKAMSFLDDQGEPMNEDASSFLVMVPVAHMGAAAAALKNPVVIQGGQAATNTLVNIGGFNFQLAVNPRLDAAGWTDKFVIFRTDTETNALIRQQEQDVQMKAVAEGSELEFNENKHRYGVDAWRNAGYGYWQRAVLTTFN